MTKQEEIREGIEDILTRYGNFMDGYDADGDELDIDEALVALQAYLHSQGVVIKVDRELPDNPFSLDYEEIPIQFQSDEPTNEDIFLMHYNGIEKGKRLMLKAGCGFFEPLIKE